MPCDGVWPESALPVRCAIPVSNSFLGSAAENFRSVRQDDTHHCALDLSKKLSPIVTPYRLSPALCRNLPTLVRHREVANILLLMFRCLQRQDHHCPSRVSFASRSTNGVWMIGDAECASTP